MKELALQQPKLIGRSEELDRLRQSLDNAIEGKGSTIFISGEAGIGKTRLVEEFRKYAGTHDVNILSGAATADTVHPFLVFSKALEGEISRPLFYEQEYTSFADIFAVDNSGLLIAKATPENEEELDADIFAGMLTAVQSFVRDSFDSSGEQATGLGRLEYGDMKVLIEHGEHLFLTAVFRGTEHPDMKNMLKRTAREIGEKYGTVLESWSGKMEDVAPIQKKISSLAKANFLVRRDLEGVKLENERIRIADQVLEILVEHSKMKPLLLVLEDLHWADESSLFVLNYIARNVRNEKILILGTLRPRESDNLQKTMEKMKDEEILTELAIEKLESDDITSLVNRIYSPNEFPPTFVDQLASQCEGNPFFVIEMLRQMREEGGIAKQDGKYVLVNEDYTIPNSVEEIVYRRLELLEPDTLALAEYASCIGREFKIPMTSSLQSLKDVSSALGKLQTTGIVITKNGTAEFSHAIFQDVIYKSIGDRWKSAYHKSLGEYYEDTYKNRLDEVLYELARHFSRSNEYAKAFDYCCRAGEKAESAFAPEQAIEFYGTALATLSNVRIGISDSNKEIEILERLGNLNSIIGKYDLAIEILEKVTEVVEDSETKAPVLRKVGDIYEKKGEYDKSLKVLAVAKELVEEGTAEYGRILFGEGYPYWKKGDFDKAMPLFLEVIKISEESGVEQKDIGDALRAIGNIHLSKGEYDDALHHYERSLAVMEEMGEQYGMAAALGNIGIVYRNKGELSRALEFYERSLEIQERIGDKRGTALSLNNIGNVHWNKGELDRALEYYERSLVIREKIGDKWGIATSLGNIGGVYHVKGALDKALEYHKRSLEIKENIGDKQGSIPPRCGLAEAYLKLGSVQSALEDAYRSLEIAVEIGARSEEGMSRRLLGMVYREEEYWGKSIEEFEKAEKILEEVGDKNELARLFYEYGLLFKARGEPDKAKEHLEKALEMFEKMGMKLWVEKAEKALEEIKQ